MTAHAYSTSPAPRLGFVGTGWIGRNRLEAIAAAEAGVVAAVVEPSPAAAAPVRERFPAAAWLPSLDALLNLDLDGIVIATPSALHAEQAIRALERGVPVFCQKPLGRNHAETRAVIEAARAADRLLGVDLSYRFVRAFTAAKDVVLRGEIGSVYAADLVFHNAYGPDKAWFYDPALAGGGCLIDLGIHLVDCALWTLGFPEVRSVRGAIFAGGRRLGAIRDCVEDYASGTLELEGGAEVRVACSWRLSAGRDAVIEASFHGTRGGVSVRNVGGSFYDFVAERHEGTRSERLVEPPDAWGGRAAVAWATRLAADPRFDPSIESVATVAAVLDRIYGNEPSGGER